MIDIMRESRIFRGGGCSEGVPDPPDTPLDPRMDIGMIQERYNILVIFYSSCFDNERNRTIQRKLSISHQPLRQDMEMVLPFDRRHLSHGFLLCFRSRHISFLCSRLTDHTCHCIYKIRRQQEQNYSTFRKYLIHCVWLKFIYITGNRWPNVCPCNCLLEGNIYDMESLIKCYLLDEKVVLLPLLEN